MPCDTCTVFRCVERLTCSCLCHKEEAVKEEWSDCKDEWSEAISAAFPTRSGSHDHYATAMRMVGNRQSKGELVALVNWLLQRADTDRGIH